MKTRAIALLIVLGAIASAHPVELQYFWAPTCPDCTVMKVFLNSLSEEFPELRRVEREVAYGSENYRLMVATAQAHGLVRYGTPMVAVGNVVTTGIGLAVELRIREEVTRLTSTASPQVAGRGEIPAPAPLPVPWAVILLGLGVALVLLFLLSL